jgi:hypothetical protein
MVVRLLVHLQKVMNGLIRIKTLRGIYPYTCTTQLHHSKSWGKEVKLQTFGGKENIFNSLFVHPSQANDSLFEMDGQND